MLSTDYELFETISSMIKPEFLKSAPLEFQENKSSYNSVIIKPQNNVYRNLDFTSLVFCRIKTTGKENYIGFNLKFRYLFEKLGIPCKSDGKKSTFFRVPIDILYPLSPYRDSLSAVLNEIFVALFSFAPFGCCSKYVQCSDEKNCLHEDVIYSSVCMYRKNLENGRIFYGKNCNI